MEQSVTINESKCKGGRGVLRGSVLGPLLLLYTNDLDKGIRSDLSRFGYDTEIGKIIRFESDKSNLQRT